MIFIIQVPRRLWFGFFRGTTEQQGGNEGDESRSIRRRSSKRARIQSDKIRCGCSLFREGRFGSKSFLHATYDVENTEYKVKMRIFRDHYLCFKTSMPQY